MRFDKCPSRLHIVHRETVWKGNSSVRPSELSSSNVIVRKPDTESEGGNKYTPYHLPPKPKIIVSIKAYTTCHEDGMGQTRLKSICFCPQLVVQNVVKRMVKI
ncbi:hypothetical protein SERLA73DRAFT_187709 [Serpula lacrymans var. lacrymans S7.3]|uniref:Uncharacterized protein n=2 Tax=Serpula lacrymans var. lacrymans TaxID=341189 RepID=F8QA71_SERL3|nr:uncharacterized protein SERLADRAFT_477470 [Serpula lacrymans var. lacrymans S7.9]EGN94661.1 hypothetical protein SERLA73DRAFT_187709 [Serpula lacrymans var. lacrymans S7.3]EGO20144.1 hypothetical protein SERLADRAFT_477470 [Serpula lacrymans var. lacrymans S7.9]